MTFDQSAQLIMDLEGGYVNDPSDPGGATKYGISKQSHPELDIQNLTRSDAASIYRKQYWEPCRCDLLPRGLDLLVFDCAVNSGTDKAIRLLQRTVRVTEDGVIGPVTLKAVQDGGQAVITEFAAQRMFQYAVIPQFTRYGLGWSRRLMKVVAQCL